MGGFFRHPKPLSVAFFIFPSTCPQVKPFVLIPYGEDTDNLNSRLGRELTEALSDVQSIDFVHATINFHFAGPVCVSWIIEKAPSGFFRVSPPKLCFFLKSPSSIGNPFVACLSPIFSLSLRIFSSIGEEITFCMALVRLFSGSFSAVIQLELIPRRFQTTATGPGGAL